MELRGREAWPRRTPLVLLVGIAAVSSASILIRWAGDPPNGVAPLAIAAWRVGLAGLLLVPLTAARGGFGSGGIGGWARREATLALVSGLLLAVHFAAWIGSLSLTTVASSVVLVTASPIWVSVGGVLLLGERLTRLAAGGIAVTVAGTVLLALSDAPAAAAGPRDPLLGDALAILGSIAVSGYMLIGRRLRRALPVGLYAQVVYGVAGVALVLAALTAGSPLTGFPTVALVPLVVLALGPQLLGHTSFNWALRYLSAPFVAVVVLAEPIVATLLAWLILGEALTSERLVAAAVILGGIYVVAREEGRTAGGPGGTDSAASP